MDKLEAYLLSKSTFVLAPNNQSKTNDIVNDVEKPTSSPTKGDPKPQKTGEILRTECGKFSFLCLHCETVCENCQEMMDHINSHFDKESALKFNDPDSEMLESPLVMPEFVSIGNLPPEADLRGTTSMANGISKKLPTVNSEPMLRNETSAKRTKKSSQAALDKTETPPTTRIVKIIKRRKPSFQSTKEESTEVCQMNDSSKETESHSTTKNSRIIEQPKTSPPTLDRKEGKLADPVDEAESSPTARIVKIIKRPKSSSQTTGTDVCEVKDSSDESTSPPTAKVVKIIKLKRVKISPSTNRTYANKRKKLIDADQKVGSQISENPAKLQFPSETSQEPSIKEPDLRVLQRQVHARLPRRCCYQCEMEPRVYEPSAPRRHICLFCPIWFPHHADFVTHVWEVHKKDPDYVACKDFYCYICERNFNFRVYLTSHLKTHKETADHLCEICGASYKTKNRLTQHMKIHDAQTFECDQCDKTFNRFDRYRKHLWCHNTNLSFVCEVCSKAFKMKRYLDLHRAVHDEPKINCRHCDAAFHFKSVRRAHERSRHNVM